MGKRFGCLITHGFAGGIHEIEPLAKHLAGKGFDVLCPELKGHTGRRRDLVFVSYKDWLDSVEECFLQLKARCDGVVLIGFSMGGLLSVNIAAKYGAAALVTLNMPIYHWDFKRIGINIAGDLRSHNFSNIKHYLNSAAIPVPALLNFKLLLARTKGKLREVTCPVYIAQALEDDTVQASSAEYIKRNIGSEVKEVKYYGKSGHLICHSAAGEMLFNDVEGFINSIISNKCS